jgi:predicted DNA-binding transcriptional regulator YafY
MSDRNLRDLNHAQQQRLFHIEFRLWFLGSVSRADLLNRFGIAEAAATRDLTLYRDLASANIEYDSRAKIYRCAEKFSPLFKHDPAQVLSALSHGLGDHFVGQRRPLIRSELPVQLNYPDVKILSVISRAIYQECPVEIVYHSLSSGCSTRTAVPFALVDNGLRWHVRAYDRAREAFLDFVITRIAGAKLRSGEVEDHERPSADDQWNRVVEMELLPHPGLKHPDTVAFEYGMKNGVLKVKLRAALTGYVLRVWNIDCGDEPDMEDKSFQLWLRNPQSLYGVENLFLAPNLSEKWLKL